jgi:hypothetical protein
LLAALAPLDGSRIDGAARYTLIALGRAAVTSMESSADIPCVPAWTKPDPHATTTVMVIAISLFAFGFIADLLIFA